MNFWELLFKNPLDRHFEQLSNFESQRQAWVVPLGLSLSRQSPRQNTSTSVNHGDKALS
jgi:hypothetical protein